MDCACPFDYNGLSDSEKKCVDDLRGWIETEVDFTGRRDEEFLIIFSRGCKFNVEKAKKKIVLYYENRKRDPRWWANRNISQLKYIIEHNATSVILIDKYPDLPTLTITRCSRISPDLSLTDDYMKLNTIYLELLTRRVNYQTNGAVWIIDSKDHPLSVFFQFLNPFMAYKVVRSYYMAFPVRVKGVYVINASWVPKAMWRLIKPLLNKKMQQKFYFYGSDWSSLLKDQLDARLLPEEYGGDNGSLDGHEEEFRQQLYAFSDYLLDDDKYGF